MLDFPILYLDLVWLFITLTHETISGTQPRIDKLVGSAFVHCFFIPLCLAVAKPDAAYFSPTGSSCRKVNGSRLDDRSQIWTNLICARSVRCRFMWLGDIRWKILLFLLTVWERRAWVSDLAWFKQNTLRVQLQVLPLGIGVRTMCRFSEAGKVYRLWVVWFL